MTTKYCMKGTLRLSSDAGLAAATISENQKIVKPYNSENRKTGLAPLKTGEWRRESRAPTDSRAPYFSCARPAWVFAALRARPPALARKRSIWPLGKVTQISPIHSSFTPLIGLALKLVRLTRVADFPRSIVFR